MPSIAFLFAFSFLEDGVDMSCNFIFQVKKTWRGEMIINCQLDAHIHLEEYN